jgi:hypothetical protein
MKHVPQQRSPVFWRRQDRRMLGLGLDGVLKNF